MSESIEAQPKGAAFFDVDRTLLAGASGLYLAPPLRRRGLLTARQLARTMLVQLSFAAKGSNHDQLDMYTRAVKELMTGWDHKTVTDVIEQELERRIRPMVFHEAIERVAQHHARGQKVYAVSATMEEVIEPLARMLGLDGAVATRMEVEDGLFTGEILEANHGSAKADRLRSFAAEHGIDLAASSAYSDSITDADFLASVGRAYAVNPDKELRALAVEKGWGILRFKQRERAPIHKRKSAQATLFAVIAGVGYTLLRSKKNRES